MEEEDTEKLWSAVDTSIMRVIAPPLLPGTPSPSTSGTSDVVTKKHVKSKFVGGGGRGRGSISRSSTGSDSSITSSSSTPLSSSTALSSSTSSSSSPLSSSSTLTSNSTLTSSTIAASSSDNASCSEDEEDALCSTSRKECDHNQLDCLHRGQQLGDPLIGIVPLEPSSGVPCTLPDKSWLRVRNIDTINSLVASPGPQGGKSDGQVGSKRKNTTGTSDLKPTKRQNRGKPNTGTTEQTDIILKESWAAKARVVAPEGDSGRAIAWQAVLTSRQTAATLTSAALVSTELKLSGSSYTLSHASTFVAGEGDSACHKILPEQHRNPGQRLIVDKTVESNAMATEIRDGISGTGSSSIISGAPAQDAVLSLRLPEISAQGQTTNSSNPSLAQAALQEFATCPTEDVSHIHSLVISKMKNLDRFPKLTSFVQAYCSYKQSEGVSVDDMALHADLYVRDLGEFLQVSSFEEFCEGVALTEEGEARLSADLEVKYEDLPILFNFEDIIRTVLHFLRRKAAVNENSATERTDKNIAKSTHVVPETIASTAVTENTLPLSYFLQGGKKDAALHDTVTCPTSGGNFLNFTPAANSNTPEAFSQMRRDGDSMDEQADSGGTVLSEQDGQADSGGTVLSEQDGQADSGCAVLSEQIVPHQHEAVTAGWRSNFSVDELQAISEEYYEACCPICQTMDHTIENCINCRYCKDDKAGHIARHCRDKKNMEEGDDASHGSDDSDKADAERPSLQSTNGARTSSDNINLPVASSRFSGDGCVTVAGPSTTCAAKSREPSLVASPCPALGEDLDFEKLRLVQVTQKGDEDCVTLTVDGQVIQLNVTGRQSLPDVGDFLLLLSGANNSDQAFVNLEEWESHPNCCTGFVSKIISKEEFEVSYISFNSLSKAVIPFSRVKFVDGFVAAAENSELSVGAEVFILVTDTGRIAAAVQSHRKHNVYSAVTASKDEAAIVRRCSGHIRTIYPEVDLNLLDSSEIGNCTLLIKGTPRPMLTNVAELMKVVVSKWSEFDQPDIGSATVEASLVFNLPSDQEIILEKQLEIFSIISGTQLLLNDNCLKGRGDPTNVKKIFDIICDIFNIKNQSFFGRATVKEEIIEDRTVPVETGTTTPSMPNENAVYVENLRAFIALQERSPTIKQKEATNSDQSRPTKKPKNPIQFPEGDPDTGTLLSSVGDLGILDSPQGQVVFHKGDVYDGSGARLSLNSLSKGTRLHYMSYVISKDIEEQCAKLIGSNIKWCAQCVYVGPTAPSDRRTKRMTLQTIEEALTDLASSSGRTVFKDKSDNSKLIVSVPRGDTSKPKPCRLLKPDIANKTGPCMKHYTFKNCKEIACKFAHEIPEHMNLVFCIHGFLGCQIKCTVKAGELRKNFTLLNKKYREEVNRLTRHCVTCDVAESSVVVFDIVDSCNGDDFEDRKFVEEEEEEEETEVLVEREATEQSFGRAVREVNADPGLVDQADIINDEPLRSVSKERTARKSVKNVCKYFNIGTGCFKGAKCDFLHESPSDLRYRLRRKSFDINRNLPDLRKEKLSRSSHRRKGSDKANVCITKTTELDRSSVVKCEVDGSYSRLRSAKPVEVIQTASSDKRKWYAKLDKRADFIPGQNENKVFIYLKISPLSKRSLILQAGTRVAEIIFEF